MYCFLMSLLLLPLLLLQLPIFVYNETTGYFENVPVLLRGTFYTNTV